MVNIDKNGIDKLENRESVETIVLSSNYYKPHIGGVENSLYHLGNAYSKLGKNVVILTSDKGILKHERLPNFSNEDGFTIIRFKYFQPLFFIGHFIKPLIDIYRGSMSLRSIKSQNRIELFIARSPNSILFSMINGINSSYLVPGLVKTHQKIKRPLRSFRNLFINMVNYQKSQIQKIALNKATHIFVFSNNMADQIKEFLNKQVPLKLVNPGIDSKRFIPKNGLIKLAINGVDSNRFIFLIVGRLTAEKGIDLAIECFMEADIRNSMLLIVGEGPMRKNLEKMVEKPSFQDRIIFTGAISNHLERYYQISDCFIMSSTGETFGQTILEALAVGLPIIAWKSGGEIQTATSEIIKHGENGLLLNYSKDEMVKAMIQISRNSEKQKTNFKKNNVKLVSQEYSWPQLALDLLNNSCK